MNNSAVVKCLFILAFLIFSFPVKALNVLFINPSQVGQPHWDREQQLIVNAAKQFNINLQLARMSPVKRSNLLPIMAALENKEQPPQAVIFLVSQHDDNLHLFSLLEHHKLPFITLENTLDNREKELLGKPKERFKYWLAEKKLDDEQAGYLLAKNLIKYASNKYQSPISLVAISGSHIATSELRNSGLYRAIAENSHISLKQLVYNNWDLSKSSMQARKLLQRYPGTRIIWAASDIGALGSHQTLRDLNLMPGKDVFIGGIDWQLDVFPLMQEGSYNVSVGGQVLAAPSALAFLYDYFNGVDIKVLNNMPDLKVDIVTSKDWNMLSLLKTSAWQRINYQNLSIKHNPQAATSPIGLIELLQLSVK